jgi:ABC-type transport system involved in multi-copper enzyme maturation permease subunit
MYMTPPLVLAQLPPWFVATRYVALGVVLALAALVVVYLMLRMALPKVAAIALTTTKAALGHPLFWVEVLGAGFIMLLFFPFMPYYTFGEDIKILKSSGLTLILVMGIILALWTASTSIADEIEGRTAVTLLSKPIRRWQFIVGKYLGILGPVALLFIFLGAIFLFTVSYKASYDAYETASPQPNIEQCKQEILQIVPGLILAFMETAVLAAISVAISTRLPMLANLIICSAVYVLGHLVPTLVSSRMGEFQLVRFMGAFLATVLPLLDDFNIEAGIAGGVHVPLSYVAWAGLYCVLYSTVALLVALILFEDRDLA